METVEQAPSTPPPKGRRRRRLIIAFVLVLVSGVTCCYWPRGDARFVGRWSRVTMGTKWADRLTFFHFYRNGGGYLDPRIGGPEYLNWWMEDDGATLCFQPGLRTGLDGLEDLFNRLSGHGPREANPVVRFSIVEVTRDRVRYRPLSPAELVDPNASHDFVLERRADNISSEARVVLSNLDIPENSQPGSLVGDLGAVNCDFGSGVAFSLADEGRHNECFEISGRQLRTRSVFEYVDEELPNVPPEVNRRWIAVRARDGGGRTFVSPLYVLIRAPSKKLPADRRSE